MITRLTWLGILTVSTLLSAQNLMLPADSASAGDNTATVPAEVRRAEPPPPNWSAQELEERADSLRAEKAYADSLDYYRAALAKRTDSTATLYNKMGMAELLMQRFSRARKAFERALKADPGYAEARNNLGVVYYMQNNYKKAIQHYLKAVALRPDSASFHSNLGTAYFARKKYEEASASYLRALELDPEVFERRSRTGVSAHMASPGDRARYSYVIARMYARAGDNDRCLLYLKKAIEQGYPEIKKVYTDEEFATVRKDPRFSELWAPTPVPNISN